MASKAKKLKLTEAFAAAAPRPAAHASRAEKKNYAERLSRQLARVFADELRPTFPGVLPDADGKGQESAARTSKGFKKLDVNYSTIQLGLALGVSVKTINFADATTKRFTKNYSRVANELRAEATDYHTRQPWAVLVAVVFLPWESCLDATQKEASSFGSAVRFFRDYAGRDDVNAAADRFEAIFIGLYDAEHRVRFFDVKEPPPKQRAPREDETYAIEGVVNVIRQVYDVRNSPPFEWADDPVAEVNALELEDDPED